MALGAFAIVKEIISFAVTAAEERKKAQLLKDISSDLSNIRSLLENVREVVKEIVNENEVNDQAANIASAVAELDEGNLDEAHDRARDAALRLMQPDVQESACTTFLLAAGADITILKRNAETNRNAANRKLLRDFAKRYARHAGDMVPIIEDSVAKRVAIRPKSVAIGVRMLYYTIDGATIGTRPLSPVNQVYYTGKAAADASALSAPLVHPLKIAAETWRSIAGNDNPDYSPIFEDCIINSTNPPLPSALIVEGRRIGFVVATTINNFSTFTSSVPSSVYHNIPHEADIQRGAKCVIAIGKPGAFVTSKDTLAPVDSQKPIDDNDSFLVQIDGVDYDKFKISGHLHIYPFFAK